MANKKFNRKQMTVVWHVDDLKISHGNGDTMDALIRKLSKQYGKEADLTIHRVKVHEYMGMKLEYRKQGKVKIYMTYYLEIILDNMPENCQGRAITMAANHIFKVNETARKLSEKEAQAFHTIVEKFLFLCKQVRPDILNGVAFLATRVRESDEDDDKKLVRILKYLSGTRDLVLTLESDSNRTVKCWVDAAFAVHHDMKSHTGRVMTMGQGALYSTSNKQKLKTKRSTEEDLVGVDDLMLQIFWMHNFLEAQGMKVSDNVVYQDNQSTMKLEKMEEYQVVSKPDISTYVIFFVTGYIQANEIKVEPGGSTRDRKSVV